MTKSFFGLTYRVLSPTRFELLSAHNDLGQEAFVTVSRHPELRPNREWQVNMVVGTAVYHRGFATRDECFALLASRRKSA